MNRCQKYFLIKELKNFKISNFDQKKVLLKNLGVEFIINKSFNLNFQKIKSINFIKKIIYKKLSPKFIFVSDNFRFGNKREGNVNSLIKYEKLL